MLELLSFPVFQGCLAPWGGAAGLARACANLGCAGIEPVWGDDSPAGLLPRGLAVGYHLTFWPDWLDFWQGDEAALARRFGSLDAARAFYGGRGPEALIAAWQADLRRALDLGARYAVFHVADATIEEMFLYSFRRRDEEVADAAADALNAVLAGVTRPFTLLLENQWWPGLTLRRPEIAARLLERVRWPDVGFMLDTGHLLCTNPDLRTEAEGAAFLLRVLDGLGPLAARVRGLHLHCSLSGAYVRAHTGMLPPDLPDDYLGRYARNYAHVLQIDRHQPWTDGAVSAVVARVAPDWLVHELPGPDPAARMAAVRTQRAALRRGGLAL